MYGSFFDIFFIGGTRWCRRQARRNVVYFSLLALAASVWSLAAAEALGWLADYAGLPSLLTGLALVFIPCLLALQQYVDSQVVPLGIIVGDVNNLKRMNDILGHLIGERMLKAVSDIIKANLPAGASAYRIGGDEFVLLLPGGTAEDAQRFIQAADAQCAATHDDQYGTPSISWGYAVRTELAQAYNGVFSQADKMMYAQKKQLHQFTSSGIVPGAAEEPPPPAPPQ